MNSNCIFLGDNAGNDFLDGEDYMFELRLPDGKSFRKQMTHQEWEWLVGFLDRCDNNLGINETTLKITQEI